MRNFTTHPFEDIAKQKTCTKFQQKLLNCRIVGARQSFQFSDKIPNFCVVFCITYSVLPKQ